MNIPKIIIKHLANEVDTRTLGSQLANAVTEVTEGAIIFLHGDLGVGKTTFVRGFLSGFNYHGKVKSPTYALVEPYQLNEHTIFHFDFYRLISADELEHIGIKDYFFENSICLIEWPLKGLPFLPEPDLDCYIEFVDKERSIRIEARSPKGEAILHRASLK